MAKKGQAWEKRDSIERRSLVRKLQLRGHEPKEMVEIINDTGKFTVPVTNDMVWRDIRFNRDHPVAVEKYSVDDMLIMELENQNVVRDELWKQYRKVEHESSRIKILSLLKDIPKDRLGLVEKAGFILKAGNYGGDNNSIMNLTNFLRLLDLILELSNNYIDGDDWFEWLNRVNILVKDFERQVERDQLKAGEVVEIEVSESKDPIDDTLTT